MQKALFVDRDGIILKMVYHQETGIITTALKPSEVKFAPHIFKLLAHAQNAGYKIIIISNQPNIGLKRISKTDFEKIRSKIKKEFKKHGVAIDAEYYCFHHPFADLKEYRKRCNCRKPQPGLLLQAIKDFSIDARQSYFIGDGVNDVLAGNRAGCKTILLANLVESEYLRILEERLKGVKPNHVVKNLAEVLTILK